jgi:hypothetical protein
MVLPLLAICALGFGCAVQTDQGGDPPLNAELGKPLMEAPPSDGKADNSGGVRGPRNIFAGGPSEVWETPNRWDDSDTEAARQAGIVWDADSGLDWNEKYARWVQSLEKIPSTGYGDTFALSTPWGFTLPAPVLECAEVAVFLRVTFASWYGLPFYLTAWSEGSNVHFGHFGVVRDTHADPRFPSFRDRYADHSALSTEEALANWPDDSELARRALTSAKDDANTFLGEAMYSGAYFDRIFLNKRVGYFMLLVLTYTGSVHLASTDNTFNLDTHALREGDTLLKRWQKHGVGHTMVVMRVDPIEGEDTVETQITSGNMPRRQPRWQLPGAAKYNFTDKKAGGVGTNGDGQAYATLGGGLKRWRAADIIDGRWRNQVPASDGSLFIPSYDTQAISERPDLFETLLVEQTPEQKMETLVALVESKRQHLRNYPASCSARIAREQAFDQMYALAPLLSADGPVGGTMTTADIDAKYRKLEDYVFAALEYDLSRTCCWNSSTGEMFQLIMEYNLDQMVDDESEMCRPPVVFKMVDGGYNAFEAYAVSVGAGDSWVAWSADESCPQASTVQTDTEADHSWVPYCEVAFSP